MARNQSRPGGRSNPALAADHPSPYNSNMPTSIEKELHVALHGTVEAALKRGYKPTYFIQMLEREGGLKTAKRLIASHGPQKGLFTLQGLGLLGESMEAVMLQERFRSLFTKEELAEARRRLEELGYFATSEPDSAPTSSTPSRLGLAGWIRRLVRQIAALFTRAS